MKIIVNECYNNFELQMHVLNCIEQLKNAKLTTQASNLADYHAARRREKREIKAAEMVAGKEFGVAPRGTLDKGLLYFKRWSDDNIIHLRKHCEPDIRGFQTCECQQLKTSCKQLLEVAFQIRCGEFCADRVSEPELPTVFEKAKHVYVQLGCRLKHFIPHLAVEVFPWAGSGIYQKTVVIDGADDVIEIQNRFTSAKTRLPKTLVADDFEEIRAAPIDRNWSAVEACIKTSEDKCIVENYFPRRSLKRVASNEGCVATASMVQSFKSVRLAKNKAKAKSKGSVDASASSTAPETSAEPSPHRVATVD
eukprot:TRINITY_DN7327_c0_g1_i1.p1 TRINITY_DN7327_c0_g1~~TRINITY_DN7327_c0_g1_i1.p1  ORF type:complete len:308 (-),score=50.88 TRINITY_DN7327_c0_g1_i1:231-1154(-)